MKTNLTVGFDHLQHDADGSRSSSSAVPLTVQKNAAISARILAFVANGASLREAMNWVLGPAYFECLVEEVYEGLRAKAGVS
jgi:hypothetical protein